MTDFRITRGDLAWSYASQFLQYGAALLVLPVLLTHLTAAEVGIWYVFNLVGMLAAMLDFGFQSAFVRNVSYVASGVRSLHKEGTQNLQAGLQIDYVLLATVVAVARSHYRRVSVWMLVALLIVGSAYVAYIAADYDDKRTLALAWLIFAIGTTYNFYWTYLGPCLNGLRAIKEAQQAVVIGRLVATCGSIGGLLADWGLLGAVSGFIAGSLAYPLVARFFLSRQPEYRRASQVTTLADKSELTATLWHNGRKAGAVAVGTFLVIRATAVIASLFLPLERFAAYAVSLQIFQVLTTMARVKFNTSMPLLSALIAKGEINRFRHSFWSSMRVGWAVYLAGACVLFFWGQPLFQFIGSDAQLLPRIELLLLVILYFLEITHGNSAMAITCFNQVPFVRATWATGIAIVTGSLIVGWFTVYGVMGFILVQLLAQMAYNAWKWPWEIVKTMRSYRNYANKVEEVKCLLQA